jgi:hypothetical protein
MGGIGPEPVGFAKQDLILLARDLCLMMRRLDRGTLFTRFAWRLVSCFVVRDPATNRRGGYG